MRSACLCVWPPPITLQVAEGAVDEAGSELSTGDEEGVNRHQLTPEVGRRGLSDVHWHCHRGNTYTVGEREEDETVSRGAYMKNVPYMNPLGQAYRLDHDQNLY